MWLARTRKHSGEGSRLPVTLLNHSDLVPNQVSEEWLENFASDMVSTFIGFAAGGNLFSAVWRFPIGWVLRVTQMRMCCAML